MSIFFCSFLLVLKQKVVKAVIYTMAKNYYTPNIWGIGFFFSIAMGADYSFYVKSIETNACAFLTLNVSTIGRVLSFIVARK